MLKLLLQLLSFKCFYISLNTQAVLVAASRMWVDVVAIILEINTTCKPLLCVQMMLNWLEVVLMGTSLICSHNRPCDLWSGSHGEQSWSCWPEILPFCRRGHLVAWWSITPLWQPHPHWSGARTQWRGSSGGCWTPTPSWKPLVSQLSIW